MSSFRINKNKQIEFLCCNEWEVISKEDLIKSFKDYIYIKENNINLNQIVTLRRFIAECEEAMRVQTIYNVKESKKIGSYRKNV